MYYTERLRSPALEHGETHEDKNRKVTITPQPSDGLCRTLARDVRKVRLQ